MTGYKDVIHVDKDEGVFLANLIYKLLEGLCCVPEPVRHHEVFIERPKGVIMAIFGTSSLCTGIWLKGRTRSTLEKMWLRVVILQSLGCETWDIDQVW